MSSTSAAAALPISAKIRSRQSRTRERILEVSAGLFVAKGFENVSVEDIIDAAEIARSSFYRFFSNRNDLLTEVIRPVFEKGIASLDAIVTPAPLATMNAVFDVYLELWRSGPNALKVSTRIGGKYFYLFEDLHAKYRSHLMALVEQVQSSGILLNDSADYSARLIARSAVPVMEVYCSDPDFEQLFHRSMRGFLLRAEALQ
ncbi:MAG: TetR/AcrR family transcriptional regulator [Gammaproteobacteria bacterium]